MQLLAAPYYQNEWKYLLDYGIVCVPNKPQMSDKNRVITTLN